jgi:ribosomal protein L16/L10AE
MQNFLTVRSKKFKKRAITGFTLPKLTFGTVGLKFDKNYTFEKLHLFVLKKKLKFFLKKKRGLKKVWFFLSQNYPVFAKGKNARMGKGKGEYLRLIFRVKRNKVFLEFMNLNSIFLKKVSLFFKRYSNLKNSVLTQKSQQIVLFKSNQSLYRVYKRF